MNLLFNDKEHDDFIIVMTYIDEFTKVANYPRLSISDNKIRELIAGCRKDFKKYKNPSAFNRLANFLVHFVATQPLSDAFPRKLIGNELADIGNHQNAIIAFNLAIKALEGAVIHRQDGDRELNNPIQLSRQSYIDIIYALSDTNHLAGFKLVTVLLEQMAYKANPDCQYQPLL